MESVQSAPSANSNSPSIPPPVSSVPPFLSKTYDMVDDPSTNEIVSWSSGNNSFVVWNVPEFSKVLLPKHFKHNNFSSFVRQLNTYVSITNKGLNFKVLVDDGCYIDVLHLMCGLVVRSL